MRTMIKTATIIILAALFISCATIPEPQQETISVTIPKGATLAVRVKTVDSSVVHVQGADKVVISGSDEVRELKEDKPMHILKASGSTITFIGNIREFDIKDNGNVEGLDISCCPNLEVLYCAGNKITDLQLSANKALKRLQCYNNQLQILDVSQQAKLELLWCGINQLSALDVSGCKQLQQLRCYLNRIETEAMDALLNSLPTQNANRTSVREARILAVGNAIKNGVPSKTAVKRAEKNGWAILNSNDTPIYP